MKKVRFFGQHTTQSCAISCMLMILEYFEIDGFDFATVGKEQQLFSSYKAWSTAGTLGSAVAYALAMRRMDVQLVHSSEQLVENRGGYYSEAVYANILQEYNEYIERAEGAFKVLKGVQIDCETLRRELELGRLVILQGFIEGNADGVHDHVPHAILLSNYEDGQFEVCDPEKKTLKMTEAEIEEFMETPLGRMYISAAPRVQKKSKKGAVEPRVQ